MSICRAWLALALFFCFDADKLIVVLNNEGVEMYTEEYDDVWNNKPAEINSDNLLQETLQKESFIKSVCAVECTSTDIENREITQSKENLNGGLDLCQPNGI